MTCKRVVVIGGGPAGIVCALDLARQGVDVLLVESGTFKHSAATQQLGDLANFDLRRHAPMEIASRRQFGGASVIWGGRCVPFDPIDFERRDYVAHSEWPIDYAEIERFHERASSYFRSGRPVFSAHAIDSISQKTIVPQLTEGDVRASDLERWSLPTNFGKEYRDEINSNPRIELLNGFTAVQIITSGTNVDGIRLRNLDGEERVVTGLYYVLSCGGLETTRLLMQPTPQFPQGLGNEGGWLGRCYMGHLSGQLAKIHFYGPAKKTIFGFLRDRDGTYVRQRFTFSPECQKKEKITNIALWLVNPKIGDPSHRNGVLSFAYLALVSPLGRFFAPEAIRQSAVADAPARATPAHVRNMLTQFVRTLIFIFTFGWKRFVVRRRIPGFFQFSGSNEYPLHYHAEHTPNLESKLAISESEDALGMKRLCVDLMFSEDDVQSIVKAHRLLDDELRRQNIGELKYFSEDLAASVWAQAQDGFHQAGTTRMSKSPLDGVVDENCRVHGITNLFVASSSTFVSSGQANSTFLIVALTLRLADYLAAIWNSKVVR